MKISKDEIFSEAVHRCYAEMYAKAQPSANFEELLEGKKNGTIIDTNEDPIYKRYYLSQSEFEYILDKYKKAYGFTQHWTPDINLLLDNLKNGGYRDSFVKDEDGNSHREAERTPPVEEIIGKENAEKLFDIIEGIRDFYRFDRNESDFCACMALGGSPTSNENTVIDYWKSQGKEITIEHRDPDTFWFRDEYGDNWKKVYYDELAEEVQED